MQGEARRGGRTRHPRSTLSWRPAPRAGTGSGASGRAPRPLGAGLACGRGVCGRRGRGGAERAGHAAAEGRGRRRGRDCSLTMASLRAAGGRAGRRGAAPWPAARGRGVRFVRGQAGPAPRQRLRCHDKLGEHGGTHLPEIRHVVKRMARGRGGRRAGARVGRSARRGPPAGRAGPGPRRSAHVGCGTRSLLLGGPRRTRAEGGGARAGGGRSAPGPRPRYGCAPECGRGAATAVRGGRGRGGLGLWLVSRRGCARRAAAHGSSAGSVQGRRAPGLGARRGLTS